MTENCWTLTYTDGTDLDTGDAMPCYTSQDEAAREANQYESQTRGIPKPRQHAEPCTMLACACCSDYLDPDHVAFHFESQQVAEETAGLFGWTRREDGSYLCRDCGPKGDCDCREDLAVSR